MQQAQDARASSPAGGGWSRDLPDGPVVFSRGVFALLGEAPTRDGRLPGGRSIADYLVAEDRQRFAEDVVTVTTTPGLQTNTYRVRTTDGLVRTLEFHGETFIDETGRPYRSIGTITDLSERVAAMDSITAQRSLLAQGEQQAHTGSFSVDVEPRMIKASPNMLRLLGFPEDAGEIHVDKIAARIHPEDLARLQVLWPQSLASDAPFSHELRVVRPDGGCRSLRLHAMVSRRERGRPVTVEGGALDISGPVANRLALSALSAGNEVLVRATSEESLLQEMVTAIREGGQYGAVMYGCPEPGNPARVVPLALSGAPGVSRHSDRGMARTAAPNVPTSMTPAACAYQSGQAQVLDDVRASEDFPLREEVMAAGLRSGIFLPVRTGGQIEGVLSVWDPIPGRFSREAQEHLGRLSADIGFGLEKIREAARTTQALTSSVDVLAAALESRDPYTAGHQSRVASLSVAIGQQMGLDHTVLQGLSLGAAIHDLGKIAVPVDLLTRPGRLMPEELAVVYRHATIGYDIARRATWPWPVDLIIYQHHERFDGSGYPQGLRGEETLTEARVVAVADVFEAIGHHRPYRPALGYEQALDVLAEGRGTQFDPDVVDALGSALDSGFQFTVEPGLTGFADRDIHGE